MKDYLKISIVTPNYNYEKYIAQTIESVIVQNYPNFEHIIVDDGSTDNSVEVIKKYVEKYPNNIKLITQKNAGQTPAINRGLKEVSGDIIVWINSDDYFCPNSFKQVASEFSKNELIDIVYGNVNVVDLDNNFYYKIRHLKYDYYFAVFYGFCKVLTSNAVFWRRRVQEDVGLLNSSLKANMDGEYFSRLLRNRKVIHLNKPLACFRQQVVSIAGKNDEHWRLKVKNEINFEIENSIKYIRDEKKISNLKIKYLKVWLKIKRIFLKIFFFHYQLRSLEKLFYRFKH